MWWLTAVISWQSDSQLHFPLPLCQDVGTLQNQKFVQLYSHILLEKCSVVQPEWSAGGCSKVQYGHYGAVKWQCMQVKRAQSAVWCCKSVWWCSCLEIFRCKSAVNCSKLQWKIAVEVRSGAVKKVQQSRIFSDFTAPGWKSSYIPTVKPMTVPDLQHVPGFTPLPLNPTTHHVEWRHPPRRGAQSWFNWKKILFSLAVSAVAFSLKLALSQSWRDVEFRRQMCCIWWVFIHGAAAGGVSYHHDHIFSFPSSIHAFIFLLFMIPSFHEASCIKLISQA
jgi:hypothetical protein